MVPERDSEIDSAGHLSAFGDSSPPNETSLKYSLKAHDKHHWNLAQTSNMEKEQYDFDYTVDNSSTSGDSEACYGSFESLSDQKETLSLSDPIPDKFSGWGLASVVAVGIFNFNTWGANSAYALYLQHYIANDVFEGASKLDYAIVGGLAFGTGLSFAPFINYLIGVVGGYKRVLAGGVFLNFVGVFLASFSTKLWHIYCTQGALSGLGMGFIAVANVAIVPQWFQGGPGGKRNLAMGLTAAGSGLGGIVYNIGMEPLLKHQSFRWSLRVQAIMGLGLNAVALVLIRSRNTSVKPVYKIYDKQVWCCFGYSCMVLWIMFTNFGYVVLMYNLGDFTRSLGYSSTDASIVSTCVAIGVVFGRPLVGLLSDIVGPINVTIIASWLVCLLSLGMWIPCRNLATAIVFALLAGALMGSIWLTMATINAAIVGLKKFGIAVSICWITTGVFGFASPIMGLALKRNGPISPTQYVPAAVFVGISYFLAGASLCVLRSWIIHRNAHIKESDNENSILNIRVPPRAVLEGLWAPQWAKV